MAAGADPFHSSAAELPEADLLQLLSAKELDETNRLTAQLRRHFELKQENLALREECNDLVEQESLAETRLENLKSQEILQKDAFEMWEREQSLKSCKENAEGYGAEFSAAKRYAVSEQFAELQFVGGNLQLESADLLVGEQESLAEARHLQQEIDGLEEQIRFFTKGWQLHSRQSEQLSTSLSLWHFAG